MLVERYSRIEVEGVMLLGKIKSSIVYKPSISLSMLIKQWHSI